MSVKCQKQTLILASRERKTPALDRGEVFFAADRAAVVKAQASNGAGNGPETSLSHQQT
jgi:hypothetical protein